MDEPRQPNQPGPQQPPPGWGSPPPEQGWPAPPPHGTGWQQPRDPYQSSYEQSSYPHGGYPPQPYSYQQLADAEAGTWAMLAHILGSLTLFVGPLIIWALKKDEHPFVKDQAAEALNFSITMFLVYAIGSAFAFVLTFLFFIGLLLYLGLAFVAVWAFCVGIWAGIRAKEGQAYRYPINLRLVT